MLPILLALAFVAVLLLVVIAGRPDEFTVAHSTNISAPPEKVFPHVNDFHQWEAWSPWAKLDPSCQNTFAGASSGPGAVFSWDGNKKVGSGRMTILEARPGEFLAIQLEFFRPFQAVNTTAFNLVPEGNQTQLTWTMSGKNNFIGKAMGLVMNCDQMVGDDFERGLAALKTVVETSEKG